MRQKTNNRTFLFLKRTALWCAAGLLGLQSAQALEVERLRTEAVKNPVGIDVEKPMFSWRMDAGDERGVKQTAYEIAVFSDASCTEQVWTSGRVESDRQIDVAYEGDKLQPSTRYYWTVTVWDNKGGESTSTEKAYFETGLMGGGWNGARWIQATDTPLTSEEEGIHHYSVEADFEVDNISTGVIFAANEDQSHYYMWQINFETGYARLRPHVYRGDQQFATCLEEIDLRPLIDLQLHQTYHLRIEVDGQTAYTYIDDVLVDTRTNPDGGNYGYGNIGVWEYGSERAYFDNIVVTDLGGETPETLISEDFSDSSNPFTRTQPPGIRQNLEMRTQTLPATPSKPTLRLTTSPPESSSARTKPTATITCGKSTSKPAIPVSVHTYGAAPIWRTPPVLRKSSCARSSTCSCTKLTACASKWTAAWPAPTSTTSWWTPAMNRTAELTDMDK